MCTAQVEIRSQHRRGQWGPDTYVAVQVIPYGVIPLITLNSKVAQKRGVKIVYFGEGYSNRQKTSRSMLSVAKSRAIEFADTINSSPSLFGELL